jgi:hypothetical protein
MDGVSVTGEAVHIALQVFQRQRLRIFAIELRQLRRSTRLYA